MATSDVLFVLVALLFALIIACLFLYAMLLEGQATADDDEPTLNTRTSKD